MKIHASMSLNQQLEDETDEHINFGCSRNERPLVLLRLTSISKK